MGQIFRYLGVGVFCAGLEYSIFMLLHKISPNILAVINAVAYGSGLIASFILNKAVVFKGQQQLKTKYQFIAYCTLAALNYSIGTILLIQLMNLAAMPVWISKILSMGAVASWNFLIYKKIIYR